MTEKLLVFRYRCIKAKVKNQTSELSVTGDHI